MSKIAKSQLRSYINHLIIVIGGPQFRELRQAIDMKQFALSLLMRDIRTRLYATGGEIDYDYELTPAELLQEWQGFEAKYGLKPTEETQKAFMALVEKTKALMDYLSVQVGGEATIEPEKSVRTLSEESIQKDIKQLDTMLKDAQQRLESARKATSPNTAEIANWEQKVKEISGNILTLRGEKSAKTKDKEAEDEWNKRLDDTFEELKKNNRQLSYDLWVARIEHWLCIAIMVVATCCVYGLYKDFYAHLTDESHPLVIANWLAYLPYALPVTVYIALMWLLLVQKNRANKISISLSTRLFNIRYLEGLMKLVNKLSLNTESAVERINTITGKMVESYLKQLEKSDVDEKKLEKIEKKEMEENPQYKLIHEILKKI